LLPYVYIYNYAESVFSLIFSLFLCPKQKAVCAVPVKDSLLEFEFEGKGSCAGSVGCCSLLESDNDLDFLTDLESKFKTLSEICCPSVSTPKSTLTHKATAAVKTTADIIEPVFKPNFEHVVQTKHVEMKDGESITSSVSTVSTTSPSMTVPQSQITNMSHSNIRNSAKLPYPTQTVVLVQQPIYYSPTPLLHCITVSPQ